MDLGIDSILAKMKIDEENGTVVAPTEVKAVVFNNKKHDKPANVVTEAILNNGKKNVVFLGNTGSGKSSFISKLANVPGIVSDGFESETMYPVCYEWEGYNLIDTPGLMDSHVSENNSADQQHLDNLFVSLNKSILHHIVIVQSAGITRLAGPIRIAMRLYSAFLGIKEGKNVVVALTGRVHPDKTFHDLALAMKGEFGPDIVCMPWDKNAAGGPMEFDALWNTVKETAVNLEGAKLTQMKSKATLVKETQDLLKAAEKRSAENTAKMQNMITALVDANEADKKALQARLDEFEAENKRLATSAVFAKKVHAAVIADKEVGAFSASSARCGGKTNAGNPCRNSINCHYRKIGKH